MRVCIAIAGVVALALVGLACDDVPPTLSNDIATADIGLVVRAEGDPQATRLFVHLAGPGRSVHLVDEDALIAHTPLEDRRLVRVEPEYIVDLAPGVLPVTLELIREPPYESAQVGFTMPLLTAIEAPASASRSEPLELRWKPDAGPQTTWLGVEGACINPLTRKLTVDEGRYIIQPADLPLSAASCSINVTLTRFYQDTLLAASLDHAHAILRQVSTRTLESTP